MTHGWCIMSNHWHLVLWPERDGDLTAFVRHLTMTHARRWKHAHNAVGHGHLYQGRFKSFPVQEDEHLLTVLRYVERNPLRAGMVKRAQDWPWGSCHVRRKRGHDLASLLADWPMDRPVDWTRRVNQPQSDAEEESLQEHIRRGRPWGDQAWVEQTARQLHLEKTLHPRGRQKGWRKAKAGKK
jgi:putative transposase